MPGFKVEAFRNYVNAWLSETGMSAAALSARAGIDQSLFAKYLHVDPRRRVRPGTRNLQKLAPVLGVPYEDLMRMCGYLPGEVPPAEIDPDLAAVNAAWPRLKSSVREAITLLVAAGVRVSGQSSTHVGDVNTRHHRADHASAPTAGGEGHRLSSRQTSAEWAITVAALHAPQLAPA